MGYLLILLQDVLLVHVNSTAGNTEVAQTAVKWFRATAAHIKASISMTHVRYVFTNERTFIPHIIPKRQ